LPWEPIERHQPILLIIDSDGDPRAIAEQIDAFKHQLPTGRIAVLADQYVFPWMLSAFRAGANAYFLKSVTSDAFIKALELVMLGETILPPELLSYVGDAPHAAEVAVDVRRSLEAPVNGPASSDPQDSPRLSSREEYILRYIGEGHPNKVIARKMGIAEGTVKVHVKAILRKIRAGNRTQAAIWLMNNPTVTRDIAPSDLKALPRSRPEKTFAADAAAIG
jgi:two-component system nitrate/nitrite response regulator NarL